MNVNIETNIKRVAKQMNVIQRKQIPFAVSVAINETMGTKKTKGLRAVMSREMNKRLDRPRKSTTTAFYLEGSKKTKLSATLGFYDWAAEFMQYLVHGGIRTSDKNIPVPYKHAKLNAYGNIRGKSSGLIKKNTQFFGKIGKASGVFEKVKDGSPKLIIGFSKFVNYKKMFPFYEIAGRYIGFTFPKKFNESLKKALRSAR